MIKTTPYEKLLESLKAVEDEIAKLQEEKDKLENEKEEGQIGKH